MCLGFLGERETTGFTRESVCTGGGTHSSQSGGNALLHTVHTASLMHTFYTACWWGSICSVSEMCSLPRCSRAQKHHSAASFQKTTQNNTEQKDRSIALKEEWLLWPLWSYSFSGQSAREALFQLTKNPQTATSQPVRHATLTPWLWVKVEEARGGVGGRTDSEMKGMQRAEETQHKYGICCVSVCV